MTVEIFYQETGEVAPERDSEEPSIGGRFLLEALGKAVAEMPEWVTAEKKGAHNIKYATLKMILERVRLILHKHGLRIRQGTLKSWTLDEGDGSKGRLIPVYTDIIHTASGEIDRTEVEIPLLRMDAQAMGSAITYGRRIMAGEASTKDIALYEHDAVEAQALAMRLHKMKLRKWLEDSK